MRWLLGGAVALFASGWLLPACEADLQTECVGGDGTCDGHPMGGPVGVTTGAGGSGGGPVCFEGCDTGSVSGNTGEFPCEVEAVMDNCRRCHTTPPASGAPFPLDTYEESQQLYFDKAVWARIAPVVQSEFMPLNPPDLTEDEKNAVIDWACQCAPPREAGEICN